MSLRPFQNRHAANQTGATGTLYRLFKFVLFAILICAAGWFAFQQTVQNKLRDHVQAKISEALHDSGLNARVTRARFDEGEGILLNDLVVRLDNANSANPTAPSSSLEIYEAMINIPATMVELVGSDLKIESVELRRAQLTLVRDANGQWDFEPILNTLVKLLPKTESPIPVALVDCEIRIQDQSNSRVQPISLTHVNVFVQPIVHEGRPLLQIHGGFQSAAISQIEFTTFLDRNTETWQASLAATEAKLSADLISALPTAIQSEFTGLETLFGKINLTAKATGKMSLDELPQFEVRGNVAGVSIDDKRLPFPIDRLSGHFTANNHGFALEKFSGKLGHGDFHVNYWQQGLTQRHQWHCDGFVNEFDFQSSPRINRWLPANCQKFCSEYSPSGTSNIRFNLTDNGSQFQRDIHGELTNMTFSFVRMPYLVENCVGKVHWKDDFCDFRVQSLTGKQVINFDGFARNLGKPSPTFQIDISIPGELPIDQKMLEAADAQPVLSKVVRAFNPTGRVGGTGRVEKREPNGEVLKTFNIRLKRCFIRHNSFDFPIHNVEGLVHVENLNYTFSKLSGNNSSGTVECDGTWDPDNGLDVRFFCKSIPLNDQLRYALKPEIGEIWDGFRPRGTLDHMTVNMKLPVGENDVDLEIDAHMNQPDDAAQANYISIHPVWFPYEINHVTGRIYIGKGQINLSNVKGYHQRTWIVCQGDGHYSDESWSVKLKNMLVGSLKIDEDLLAAVPSALAPPIRQLEYEGLVNVNGEITIAGTNGTRPRTDLASRTAQPPQGGQFLTARRPPITKIREATTSMAWNLQLVMNQAKMLIGLPVENVFGSVQLVGQYDGQNAECRGELNIDSLTVYDAQITKVRGPIWLDNSRAAAGTYARPFRKQPINNFSPIGNPEEKPRQVTGMLHGGVVRLDAQMNSGPTAEFLIQARLDDGCLKTACREFGADLDHIEGHSHADLYLRGDYSGTHSHRGGGTIQLSNAEIYELPLFLSLLKILNVGPLTRTAFDSANIEFTVHGEDIDFDRMEFIGDAISLIGNGKMNLDWEIDLNFYSVMGRGKIYIPLVSEIYRASSQKVLWINVIGTLYNPQMEQHVLPGLSDSLRQLVQPRERPDSSNRIGLLPKSQPTDQDTDLSIQLPEFPETIERR